MKNNDNNNNNNNDTNSKILTDEEIIETSRAMVRQLNGPEADQLRRSLGINNTHAGRDPDLENARDDALLSYFANAANRDARDAAYRNGDIATAEYHSGKMSQAQAIMQRQFNTQAEVEARINTLDAEDRVASSSSSTSSSSSSNNSNSTNTDNGTNSPLDQFEIRDLISLDAPIFLDLRLSVTNIGLYLSLGAFMVLALNLMATNRNKVISNRWSLMQETIYATVLSIVINQINSNKGQMYFPFIYGLFLFILINNLIGMVPYSFASTSHFILAFSISFTVVLGATFLGFNKHGTKFFSLFVPAGCPLGLLPLLVLIEFISYLARNVSLGLRLSANILSGHMLLNILAGFCYNIMTSGFLFLFVGLIPLTFIIAFSGLELGIAFIQAQVFVVLTSSYIKDALDLH